MYATIKKEALTHMLQSLNHSVIGKQNDVRSQALAHPQDGLEIEGMNGAPKAPIK